METDSRIYILGEDILDPYGGAFKVTRGLSTRFPERVLTTPISEAGIVGLAIGMGMRGLRPVVEIMFGDFVTLIADQMINHAAKFRWMYNEKVHVPIVVRTPMGGRRGYGPTHSQSLEKLFLGIPGLKVVAPNAFGSPGRLIESAIMDNDPILFIEHKLLYTCPIREPGEQDLSDFSLSEGTGPYPAASVLSNYPAKVTIATYGYSSELALTAIQELLMEHEIFCDLIIFSQLHPCDLSPLSSSLARTGRLVTVEEGSLTMGWGAEVIARTVEETSVRNVRRVAACDLPVPSSKNLEEQVLPTEEDIVTSVLSIISE